MSETLEFVRGPLFVMTFLFMVLGLLRHCVLRSVAIVRALRRTPKKDVPWRKVLGSGVGWLVPVTHVFKRTPVINVTSSPC